jgi:hypothetical protein
MTEPLVTTAGEMSIDELLTALRDGRRVVVETEFAGSDHEVTLRWDGEIYYCDTPMRLHKHESEDEMRTCIRNQGYAREDAETAE